MYECVDEVAATISINGVLPLLNVSVSGFYDWRNRKPSKQSLRKSDMKKRIKEIHEDSFEIYGAPKITAILHKEGVKVSQRTISTYMKEENIKAHYRKKYTRTTLNSDFSSKLIDRLERNFTPVKANAVWCTDITYIWTSQDEFVYLTSIMDLYSKKIIAWELTKTLHIDAVVRCVEKALDRRNLTSPVIIHSDRGSQYESRKYLEILGEELTASYSRRGNPRVNACIESFHAVLKREWLERYRLTTYEDAYKTIFEYIETFYNTRRIHGSCRYQSPNEFEKQRISAN